MWLDQLYGGAGDDLIYGFEGDDIITGGNGNNRLFGDAGNDLIILGRTTKVGPANPNLSLTNPDSYSSPSPTTPGADNFASGGTGNDHIIGTQQGDTVLGGPGNDFIETFRGNDYIDGGDGDDFINPTFGQNEVFGGRGNDIIFVRGPVTDP